MPPMDASDNTSQQSDRVSTQSDNFNRADLYNGASANRGDMATGNSNQGDQNRGINHDHIDFSQAGDIYGGKGGVQQAGLSGERNNDSNSANTPEKPQGPMDRFGRSTESRPDIPKDGVIKPDAPAAGREITTDQLREGLNRNGPQEEGKVREAAAPQENQSARAPEDRVLANQQNGQTSEVSAYTAQDNKLTNYKLDNNGDVSSRTTTDLNNNSVDTVQFGENGRAVGHQVSETGGPAHDAPIDRREQVNSIVGQDGKVKSIESSSPEGSSKITLNDQGMPASTDKETYGPGNSRDTVHQSFNNEGKPYSAESKHFDEKGQLRSTETSDGVHSNKTTFDENRKVVQTDHNSPNYNSTTKYTDTGSVTATEGLDGHKTFEVKNNDGSSMHSEYDPISRSQKMEERTADGSSRTTVENQAAKNTFVQDKASGAWARETVNKNSGQTHKQYGVPGMAQPESWTEQSL